MHLFEINQKLIRSWYQIDDSNTSENMQKVQIPDTSKYYFLTVRVEAEMQCKDINKIH